MNHQVFDHFRTQIPYALYCGLSALLLGFLPAAYGMPPGMGIFFALTLSPAISVAISFIPGVGGAVPTYSPAVDGPIGNGIWGVKASILSWAGKPVQRLGSIDEGGVEVREITNKPVEQVAPQGLGERQMSGAI